MLASHVTPLTAVFSPLQLESAHFCSPRLLKTKTMQKAMVLWLLETGTQDVGAMDVYGNMLLHYLASTMWVNGELLGRIREVR
jgi:hypothetical protein